MSTKVRVVVGGKWTSQVEVEGWRHFVVVSVRTSGQVELAASCAPKRRVFVEREALARRVGWSPGWLGLVAR